MPSFGTAGGIAYCFRSPVGGPCYAALADMDLEDAGRHVAEHVGLLLRVARQAIGTVRPGSTLLYFRAPW